MTGLRTVMVTAAAAAGVSLLGCGAGGEHRGLEYMPDMARGPAYKAFAPNAATRDGLTLQAPVAGTIPRGGRPFPYGPGEPEAIRAGRELSNPLPLTGTTIDEGRALYQNTCIVCHGAAGKGDGPLAGKIPPPPAYDSVRVAPFPPGRIFHVITMGSGKMPPHAALLSPAERWKVVSYVSTTLQGGAGRVAANAQGGTP